MRPTRTVNRGFRIIAFLHGAGVDHLRASAQTRQAASDKLGAVEAMKVLPATRKINALRATNRDQEYEQEHTMEKTRSFSQKTRITKQTGAETMNKNVDSSDIRQKMIAHDDHYHAEKLGLGGHNAHEGWIHAEEAEAATHAAIGADARHEMVAVAAYYLAEKRGFAGNCADEDWMTAEVEIDAMLHGRI